MTTLKTLSLFILLLLVFSNCKEEINFSGNTGELKVHLKSLMNADIQNARVALTFSQNDFVQNLFLEDTVTNEKGIYDFGKLNSGNYYLFISTSIGGKLYIFPKLIQIKPGDKTDMIIYPEKMSGSLLVTLQNSGASREDTDIKIENIKLAAIPNNETTINIIDPKELLTYSYGKAQTDANGQAKFENLPEGYYDILIYTDNGEVSSRIFNRFLVEPKKEKKEKLYITKNWLIVAGKTWKVQNVTDLDGNVLNTSYSSFNFKLDYTITLNLTDNTSHEGSYSMSQNNLNIYFPFSSWNSTYVLNSNTQLSMSYYDNTYQTTVIVNLTL